MPIDAAAAAERLKQKKKEQKIRTTLSRERQETRRKESHERERKTNSFNSKYLERSPFCRRNKKVKSLLEANADFPC